MTTGHKDYLEDLWDLLPVDFDDVLENPPIEDESHKAPTSEWAFDHNADVSAHHVKFTPANARAAINNIFGADGLADSDIDLDTHDLIGGNVILPANGRIGVTDGNPQIVFDNANNWLEVTGRVGIGIANPLVSLDIPGNVADSSAKFGAFEIQSYAVNNCWVVDNLHFVGIFRYRADGFGAIHYFVNGGWQFVSAPNGLAGAAAVLTTRMQIANTGLVTIADLAGVGNRNVVVNAAGALSAP